MSQFPQLTSNLSTANFRASVLTQLAQGIPVSISGSTGATDYELVVSTYTCKTAFTGASVGDIITQTQIIAITGGVATTLKTIWRNQTTAVDLVSAPASASLALNGTTALTQAQLQAMSVAATQSGTWSVGVNNFPSSTEISNDAGNPVPVSGTITANAGTNLNTSALALESGGNLASIATSLTNGTQTTSVIIPATFVTGQAKIAVTGTAVQLPSGALTKGVLISSLASNTASITIGSSSAVTNVVTGTGNGAILVAGSTKSVSATNTSLVWINGTAGDIVSFIGS